MISTTQQLHDESGLSIYVTSWDEREYIELSIQGDKDKFVISQYGDSVFFKGNIKVSTLEELRSLFCIALDCQI